MSSADKGKGGGVRSVHQQPYEDENHKEVIASRRISNVISHLKEDGYSRYESFPIGKIESRMEKFAKEHNIELNGKQIYMNSTQIAHSRRALKQNKGIAVSDQDLIDFPKNRRSMRLYYDTNKRNFVYTDFRSKFVIQPNRKIKVFNHKAIKTNFVTASKTSSQEFNMKNYIEIK